MELGIGLIGAGFMAKAHSNAYKTIPYIYYPAPYTIRLAALGAATLQEAQQAAARYGYACACEGYEAVIARDDVQVVDVSTSDALHAQIAIAALRAGKHVICEKPMALTSEDARRMLEASNQTGAKAMIGFNYRFLPAVRLAKNLIDGGVIGKIYNFSGSYNQDSGAYDDLPVERVWYAAGSKGSGVGLGIGSHLVDMARHLCGEITSVSGLAANHNPVRMSAQGPVQVTQEEELMAVASFASGATGVLRASAVSTGRKNQLAFEICGSRGSLVFTTEAPNFLQVFLKDTVERAVTGFTNVDVTQIDCDHPFMQYWWPRGHGIGWEHAHINELAYFLDCIAQDKPLAPYGGTFQDGYRSIQIIDAIKHSSKTGQRVELSAL